MTKQSAGAGGSETLRVEVHSGHHLLCTCPHSQDGHRTGTRGTHVSVQTLREGAVSMSSTQVWQLCQPWHRVRGVDNWGDRKSLPFEQHGCEPKGTLKNKSI